MPKIVRVGKRGSSSRNTKRERKLLTTDVSEPLENFLDFSTFIYGEKKVGKTSLLAEFEGLTFIFTEPGYKGLSVRKNIADDWLDIKGYVEQLEEDDNSGDPQHQAVALDTVDYAYDMCFRHVCKKLGIDHPHDENDFGKSWGAIKKEFESVVKRLLSLKKGCFFLSHAKLGKFERRDGESHSKLTATLTGQPMDVVAGLFDNIFYYGYDGADRVLVLRGDETLEAGTRLKGHFVTKKKRSPIISISMGESSEEGHANLLAGFNNELSVVGEMPTIAQRTKKKGSSR